MKVITHPELLVLPLTKNFGYVLKEGTELIKMPYWVSAGTALGLYRDKDYIVGDTDIDIEVKGYEGIEKDIFERMKGFQIVREVYDKGKPMQLAFMKYLTIFDIYIYWEEGDDLVNNNDMCKMVLPKRFTQTKNIKTKYGDYPFPNPIEEYLEYRYGKDWKIPSNKKGLYGNDF